MPSLFVEDGELAFTDSGPRHRPALLLLHGFLGCKDDWQRTRQNLDRDFRVVAVDLPGHGETRCRHFPEDYTIDGCCRALDGLARRLGLQETTVVGYSMGGRVALAYALSSHRPLRGLVLESTSPGIAFAAERDRRAEEDEERAARLEREGLPAFLQSWEAQPLFASQATLAPALARSQRELRLRGDARELAASLRAAGTGVQPWLGERLGSLQIPVLLVTGGLDAKFSAIAAQMAASLPNATWRKADGAGHNVHLEQPDFFDSVLAAFLEEDRDESRQPAGPSRREGAPS